ncbi:unnamed protein product, partial [Polarella glacialis]
GEQPAWGGLSFARNTFRALSDWGDEFERRHFDGDFLGSVSSAPLHAVQQQRQLIAQVGEHAVAAAAATSAGASRLGGGVVVDGLAGLAGELGSAAAKLVEEAAGRGSPGATATTTGFRDSSPSAEANRSQGGAWPSSPPLLRAAGPPLLGRGAASASQPEDLRGGRFPSRPVWGEPTASAVGAPPLRSPPATSPWEEARALQSELERERELRQGRSAALGAQDETLRSLRTELLLSGRGLQAASESRQSAEGRVKSIERGLEGLQEANRELQ